MYTDADARLNYTPTRSTTGLSASNFEIVVPIGAGASGRCYIVRWLGSTNGDGNGTETDKSDKDKDKGNDKERLFVMKEVDIGGLTEEELSSAMEEASTLRKLHHPNVIGYRGHFVEDGALHLLTDYADDGDLDRLIEKSKRPFSEEKILDVFMQLVLAVQYVHSNSIVHRDIKPANIYMTRKGIVKLGDFGVAKVQRAADDFMSTVAGTPHCLAPELWEGRPYNHKCDIWSLGCVLVELCVRKPAFSGKSLPALMMAILEGSPHKVPSHYSADLADLVSFMLVRDPSERPDIDTVAALPMLRLALERFVERMAKSRYLAAKQSATSTPTPSDATPNHPSTTNVTFKANSPLPSSSSTVSTPVQGSVSGGGGSSLSANVPWHNRMDMHSPADQLHREYIAHKKAEKRAEDKAAARRHHEEYMKRVESTKAKVRMKDLKRELSSGAGGGAGDDSNSSAQTHTQSGVTQVLSGPGGVNVELVVKNEDDFDRERVEHEVEVVEEEEEDNDQDREELTLAIVAALKKQDRGKTERFELERGRSHEPEPQPHPEPDYNYGYRYTHDNEVESDNDNDMFGAHLSELKARLIDELGQFLFDDTYRRLRGALDEDPSLRLPGMAEVVRAMDIGGVSESVRVHTAEEVLQLIRMESI